jgi:hypothetical protein
MIARVPTTQNARSFPGVFQFLLLLIALLMAFLAIKIRFQTDHARQKHDSDPDLAEQCLNRRGVAYAFIESSGRVHLICAESETEFYDVIYKDRGQLDGITAFRVNSMTNRGVTYEFNALSEYVEFLSWRGDTRLSVSQFPGPFTFVWP